MFYFSLVTLNFHTQKKLLISDVTKCKTLVEWFIHIKGPFTPGFNVNVCLFVGITFCIKSIVTKAPTGHLQKVLKRIW